MNIEERAEITLKEYQKLRKFITTLDLPLREKEIIVWRIEAAEKDAIVPLSKSIEERTIKKLKENI